MRAPPTTAPRATVNSRVPACDSPHALPAWPPGFSDSTLRPAAENQSRLFARLGLVACMVACHHVISTLSSNAQSHTITTPAHGSPTVSDLLAGPSTRERPVENNPHQCPCPCAMPMYMQRYTRVMFPSDYGNMITVDSRGGGRFVNRIHAQSSSLLRLQPRRLDADEYQRRLCCRLLGSLAPGCWLPIEGWLAIDKQ